MLIISREEIRDLLPMEDCIAVMGRAMRAASRGEVQTPPRIVAPLEDDAGFFFLMPGTMREPAVYGAKVIGLQPGSPAKGWPAVQGFVTLFDRNSGRPVALMDGAEITSLRTAAASALATDALARRAAASHGILGTGVLAASHLEAIACVRNIGRVAVWGRNAAKAQEFAARHDGVHGMEVKSADNPALASACDVVSVVTNSPTPVLEGAWLSYGAHINLVGAHEPGHREADSAAVSGASIYVDSRESAQREAGDILIPMAEGSIPENAIVGEIGEVLDGRAPGRSDEAQRTLYKSLGIVAQDLFAAEQVYRAALEQGKGTQVSI